LGLSVLLGGNLDGRVLDNLPQPEAFKTSI
jgi:hypothetical protein